MHQLDLGDRNVDARSFGKFEYQVLLDWINGARLKPSGEPGIRAKVKSKKKSDAPSEDEDA